MTNVEGELLRFFIYWRQQRRRTDYDLSALFLDEQYGNPRHISWTYLGLEPPADLPPGSRVYRLERLGELIPA